MKLGTEYFEQAKKELEKGLVEEDPKPAFNEIISLARFLSDVDAQREMLTKKK